MEGRIDVTREDLFLLLRRFKTEAVTEKEVVEKLSFAPVLDLGYAALDMHRALRKGFPEVVYGAGKSTEQIVEIVSRLNQNGNCALVTRISTEVTDALRAVFPGLEFTAMGRCARLRVQPVSKLVGRVGVVCAGTSDLPVAEEATFTLETLAHGVENLNDVGVAGLHRILAKIEIIEKCDVVIVVAGMEGALPSVIAGLISKPIIAVPTSVGYGSNFGGVTALLGMLNSCGSGVTVVNIDNGFGAAYAASQILKSIYDPNRKRED